MARFPALVAAIVCVIAVGLVGCSTGRSEHRFYTVRIDFKYAGHIYHETWVAECDAYADDPRSNVHPRLWIKSRWPGFAKRLPDGSGVYFKPREEICNGNEVGQVLFGRAVDRDIWRFPYRPDEQQRIDASEIQDPGDYVDPNVYWLDSVTAPTRVEACVYSACARSSSAKVQLLSISGDVSSSRQASDPTKEIPALATLTRGATRIVGYACWRIPADELAPMGISTPDYLLNFGGARGASQSDSGYARSYFLVRELRVRHLPLLNAWTLQSPWSPALAKVDDRELSDPDISTDVLTPRLKWARGCERQGDTITFGGVISPSAPMTMSLRQRSDQSPTTFTLSTGEQLSAGEKYPRALAAWNGPNDPLEFAAASSDSNRTFYIAEAHVLTLSY